MDLICQGPATFRITTSTTPRQPVRTKVQNRSADPGFSLARNVGVGSTMMIGEEIPCSASDECSALRIPFYLTAAGSGWKRW